MATALTDREVEELRSEVAWACRILAEHGYRDLTLGHVSARDPGNPRRIWIKRRGLTLAEIEPEDVIAVDLDNHPEGATPDMHLETVLHTEVYRRREDVTAVAHGHPPYSTALGATDAPLLHLTHDAVLFDRGVATFEDADLVTEVSQAEEVAEALGDNRAVLMRNHGVLVAGADVRWLVLTAVTLERAVMLQSIAATLGNPSPIEAGMLGDLNRRKYDDFLVNEYWDAWVRELCRRGLGIKTSKKEA
ncbi:MAG: class II aldolase/adducin family protein [Actinobacteria bacterium]|nr:class II aldolase/adducin family protein [Actinomycetota bacterium]